MTGDEPTMHPGDGKQHVNIQTMEQFGHLMQYMDHEDYENVIAAFDRAYKKMIEKGVKL
jgi:hypothetical protein